MRSKFVGLLTLSLVAVSAISATAQTPQEAPASSLVSKTVHAIGFQVGGGRTKVDMKGTQLLPGASGEAKIEAKKGNSFSRATENHTQQRLGNADSHHKALIRTWGRTRLCVISKLDSLCTPDDTCAAWSKGPSEEADPKESFCEEDSASTLREARGWQAP